MSQYFAAMFRRRPNQGWFTVGRYDATTVDILCALAVASMFLYGFSIPAWSNLLFNTRLIREEYEIWRIFTWPIATPPQFFALIGVIFFWIFGQHLEGIFGRNKFFTWVLAVAIIPAVLSTLFSFISSDLDLDSFEFGLSTLFLGGIWVYAATYPGVRWFEVIPLWAIAAVFTVLNLLQYSGARAAGQIIFLLLACATALVAGRSLGLATGWPIPHLPLTEGGSGGRRRSKPPKSKARRSGERVVEGPWQRGPAPQPPRVVASPADQAELDSLLDKIGAQGMDSLSNAEKKRLNELSKRLRNS